MAIATKSGIDVSFESEDLIQEVKTDITEFGGNAIVAVWVRNYDGAKFISNYDFIDEDVPITEDEILDCEELQEMSLRELLHQLEKQDAIV